MSLPKPSSHLDWAEPIPSKVVEPSAAKKLLGWVALERPPFEFFNWLFFTTDEWLKYLESVTDETAFARVDAIVHSGGSGTHTNLQAAHDDAAVVKGSTILITSDLDLDATVVISKPDIEIVMKPGLRFHKGSGAPATTFTGIRVDGAADRVRLMHLAFGSATPAERFSGAGDIALDIDTGARHVFLFNPLFVSGNSTDLVDDGTDTEILAPQAGLIS